LGVEVWALRMKFQRGLVQFKGIFYLG
jgi:hypothetical protein